MIRQTAIEFRAARSVLISTTIFLGAILSCFPAIATGVETASPFSDQPVKTAPAIKAMSKTMASAPIVLPTGMAEALAFNAGRHLDSWYKPIAPWTGDLVLPAADQRLPDGSVFIKVTSAPDAALQGKTLRLAIRPGSKLAAWADKIRPDVEIPPKALAGALKSGNRIPFKLNGWKSVSVLESLAAARPQEMSVALPAAAYVGDRILIDEEPVQISGSRVALVRFAGPAQGEYRKVVHFDPVTKAFTGVEEMVAISPRTFRRASDTVPMTDTNGIENSISNTDGWYIFGSRTGKLFLVEALEPRAALRIAAAETVHGKDRIKVWLKEKQFAGLKTDLFRQTLWAPSESGKDLTWNVGSRGLLVHLFGWRKSPAEKKNGGIVLGIVTGHFAFGEGRVVECPFTGESRWDIEYFQIYCHNPNWIVSSPLKWHAYMGNLRRGWMFTVPVSDTIVQLPGQGRVGSGDRAFDLFEALRRQFGIMMAIYRTGSGRGITTVRTDISCVQDSHGALYGTFREFEEFLKPQSPAARSDTSEKPLLAKAQQLVRDIEAAITFHGIPSGKWRAFFNRPESQRYSNAFTIILDSMLSAGTIFPRNAHDRMIEMMSDHGLPMYNILISQIAGRIEGLEPVAATSPRRR